MPPLIPLLARQPRRSPASGTLKIVLGGSLLMRSSLSILGSCKSSPLSHEMHQPRIHSRVLTFDLQRSLGSYCFNYVVIVAMRAIFVATAVSMECESLCNQLTCLSSKSLTSFRNALLHFLHIRVWAIGQLLLG